MGRLRWRKYRRGNAFQKHEVYQLWRDKKVLAEVCPKESIDGLQYWYFYTLNFQPPRNTAGTAFMGIETAKAAALDWVKSNEKVKANKEKESE